MITKDEIYPEVNDALIKEHGISKSEYTNIQSILNRNPNFVELGIFSVMWSEHCSYKSSIKMLKTLPRSGGKLLVDAGEENAGLVDLGNGLATSFKIESHNHPSAVEPYEGAATGVGGIMRDVFTMGARPIASMNSLRFGSLENSRNRFLLEHVVQGIADYGNCLGVPTVGGEVVIENCYSGNPLVNAMTVGVMESKNFISAISEGEGNPVFIVGSSTGRDCIHGATFASEELTEETESKKSNVQVGDPFTEKLLLEASLELAGKDWLVGMQDMGAAGITCSCSEMSAKGKSGIRINLDKVPLREKNMNAYEIMLSESQERMLVVVKKGSENELKEIFSKWELDCTEVGVVTDTCRLEVYHLNELVADIPTDDLVLGGGAPQYDMPSSKPEYLSNINSFNINELANVDDDSCSILMSLLSFPNITSKEYIYNQYDSTVRTNTVVGPGSDAAVVRIKDTDLSLSISTDCNGSHVYINPRQGGMMAVAEAARNVVCSGAEPLAITNCLNFGNPQDPEIYWQFKEAVLGMGDMCRKLNTPVTGGNVSFYNETIESAVYPTPVIGMVGLSKNKNITTLDFKNENDIIVMIGPFNASLAGSSYLKLYYDKVCGPLPLFNMDNELNVQKVCYEAIDAGIISSAHDLSDGGLSVAIAESVISSSNNLGAYINVESKLTEKEVLFGECPSIIIVSLNEDSLYDLVLLAEKYDVNTQTIGRVTNDSRLVINDSLNIDKDDIIKSYTSTLDKIMKTN